MADLAHASEGDTDLHGDPDARHWAERFAAKVTLPDPDPGCGPLIFAGNPLWATDEVEELMLVWFAGAIETGRMKPLSGPSPAEADRILPDYSGGVLGQELNEAVMMALGAASVCWDPDTGDAVFDSGRAEQIGKELIGIVVQFAKSYQEGTDAVH
jgi:hypothetical protein